MTQPVLAPNSGMPVGRRKVVGDAPWRMILWPVREVGGLTVLERRPAIQRDAATVKSSDPASKARSNLPVAAGVLCVSPRGRVLLLRRSSKETTRAGYWALPGGHVDPGETPKHAAARETKEEAGYDPSLDSLRLISRSDGRFWTYLHQARNEFEPRLNKEHEDWQWARPDALPSPLHPGIKKLFSEALAQDEAVVFAIDKKSVRRLDADGRMHVAVTPISKATVNPYWGREIPGYESLGLDPDRQYDLLRDPDELARASATFNNLPLLSKHVPVSVLDHHPDLVVGSTGTDARFNDPYLTNSLVIWAKSAIDNVESGDKQEISCAYRYTPDMTPGTYKGKSYDGVMRDIIGNHVALVKEGRAGPDVVVGDSKTKKEQTEMAARKPLSRVATLALGATIAFLRPRLAQDEKVDLMPIFRRITPKNYVTDLPKIVQAVERAVEGKLAFDATPEGLHVLLEALSKVAPKEEEIPAARAEGKDVPLVDPMESRDADMPEEEEKPLEGTNPEDDPEGGGEKEEDPTGGGKMDEIKSFIKANMDPEAFAKLEEMMSGTGDVGKDDSEPPKFAGKPLVGGKVGKDKKGGPAMDEVQKMIMAAVNGERRQAKELREAEQFVFPFVGRMTGAFDSAEQVYRKALEMKRIDAREVREVPALRILLSTQKKMIDEPIKPTPRVAQDSASMDDYYKMFGNSGVGFA